MIEKGFTNWDEPHHTKMNKCGALNKWLIKNILDFGMSRLANFTAFPQNNIALESLGTILIKWPS